MRNKQPYAPALLVLAAILAFAAPPLEVRLDAGRIRAAAPHLDFLMGQPAERLRNGAPVPFAIALTLSRGERTNAFARDTARYVVSYDLWEEKYSVVKLGTSRSVSHLAADAAENWCIGELSTPAEAAGNERFWVRIDVRALRSSGRAPAPDEPVPISLGRLIDWFSRKPEPEEPQWSAEAGPMRISDLEKRSERRSNGRR